MDEHPRAIVPPTPVPGLNLRTWLAGCAMSNANVVNVSDPVQATKQALEVADKMLIALKVKVPSKKSMRAPTVKEMARLSQNIVDQKLRDEKVTLPAMKRKKTASFEETLPDPNRPNGRYSVLPPGEE